jgi:hypothetical protein
MWATQKQSHSYKNENIQPGFCIQSAEATHSSNQHMSNAGYGYLSPVG